jgi:hypothetical protein
MKSETTKTSKGKLASYAIVAVALAGVAGIWSIADFSAGTSLLSKIFILFLGAVIVLQIVPCVMLLSAMFKGFASLLHKKQKVEVGGGKK